MTFIELIKEFFICYFFICAPLLYLSEICKCGIECFSKQTSKSTKTFYKVLLIFYVAALVTFVFLFNKVKIFIGAWLFIMGYFIFPLFLGSKCYTFTGVLLSLRKNALTFVWCVENFSYKNKKIMKSKDK